MEQNKQKSNGARTDIDELKNPFTGFLNERDISQYFRTGWSTFWQYPLGFIGFTLLVWIVKLILTLLASNMNYFIVFLLGIVIHPLFMGDYIVSVKLLKNQSCKFSDFFATVHFYRSLIIYTTIYEIIFYTEYLAQNYLTLRLLCGLTIIVLSVLFLFAPLIIFNRRPGLLQALSISRQTVLSQLSGILIFCFYITLILLIPGMALFWGTRFTTTIAVALPLISIGAITIIILQPIVSCAITAAYAGLLGLQSEKY